jgi:hypothetical protein
MAQAEQRYLVSHPSYASLEQLRRMAMSTSPVVRISLYDIDAGTDHFTITATYYGPDPKAPKHIRIDDARKITQD